MSLKKTDVEKVADHLLPHEKDPRPMVDKTGLVHLTWLRRTAQIHTSLCSSIADPIRVTPCEQEYPTCLRCIDIVGKFW